MTEGEGLLDTNVVVSYLTEDHPEQADAVARVIDGKVRVWVSLVVLVEAAFVLIRKYGLPRETVVEALINLIQKENVQALGPDKALIVAALTKCRPSGRVSFADAALWAEAQWSGLNRVYSFDTRFPAANIEVVRP